MQRTALVVDDSKSARFALRRYLESRSFKVDTADSAEQAYLALRQQRPDLIFLDHIMPDVDGFQALRQLKGDPATAGIPVIICSSNEGDAFVAEARGQGAVDVLPKPPTPAHLIRVLESVEQQHSALEIEQSLAAAEEEAPLAELAPPTAPAPQAELVGLKDALRELTPQLADSAQPQLAALEARVAALEQKIDQELAALRSAHAHELNEAVARVLSQMAEALRAPKP